MPLVRCVKNDKPGWKWGDENLSCFTYVGGDPISEAHAKSAAFRQGQAMETDKKAEQENDTYGP